MRALCLLILIVFLAAVGIFAVQNEMEVTVRFLQYSITTPLAALVGVAYLVGMISGWTVIGVLRRSAATVLEPRPVAYNRGAPAR